jgi:DNA adenine methylase
MLPYLRPNLPAEFNDYYEPFLGGGALALDIMERCWKAGDTKHTFHLSDYSHEAVDAWTAVKDHHEELESVLRSLFAFHSREQFNRVRDWDKDGLLDSKNLAERGARIIYLLMTCFGGRMTVNDKGWLRSTYAPTKDVIAYRYDFENLRLVSEMLNALDVRISHASYEVAAGMARFGDFIYLDPPYETTADVGEPLTSDYLAEGIDHGEVKRVILEATAAGALVLMSNSDTAVTRSLFENWACIHPDYVWHIGGTAKDADELMVANWRLADHLRRLNTLAA